MFRPVGGSPPPPAAGATPATLDPGSAGAWSPGLAEAVTGMNWGDDPRGGAALGASPGGGGGFFASSADFGISRTPSPARALESLARRAGASAALTAVEEGVRARMLERERLALEAAELEIKLRAEGRAAAQPFGVDAAGFGRSGHDPADVEEALVALGLPSGGGGGGGAGAGARAAALTHPRVAAAVASMLLPPAPAADDVYTRGVLDHAAWLRGVRARLAARPPPSPGLRSRETEPKPQPKPDVGRLTHEQVRIMLELDDLLGAALEQGVSMYVVAQERESARLIRRQLVARGVRGAAKRARAEDPDDWFDQDHQDEILRAQTVRVERMLRSYGAFADEQDGLIQRIRASALGAAAEVARLEAVRSRSPVLEAALEHARAARDDAARYAVVITAGESDRNATEWDDPLTVRAAEITPQQRRGAAASATFRGGPLRAASPETEIRPTTRREVEIMGSILSMLLLPSTGGAAAAAQQRGRQ